MKFSAILFISLLSTISMAGDEWFCREGSSYAEGSTFFACGIGNSKSLQKSKIIAREEAEKEFFFFCEKSIHCKGFEYISVPMRTNEWKPHQKKNMIKYLKKAFEYALDNDYIPKVPMPNIKVKTSPRVKSFLNEREVKEFLYEAKVQNNPWFPIWLTAIHTGMRASELRGLTWEAVDMDGEIISVYKTLKRHEDIEEESFSPTKSRVDRTIPISKPLYKVLVQLRFKSDSQFVLPLIEEWKKGEQARCIRLFLETIGLPSIRFHDLRATFCTLMLSKGVPPITVMKIGGWKEMDTMDKYVRLSGVEVAGKTDCLDSIDVPDVLENVVNLSIFQK